MFHFNYKDFREKLLNMFRQTAQHKHVGSYGHQGLSEVVHKWVNSK
jgi:hypothetical protein